MQLKLDNETYLIKDSDMQHAISMTGFLVTGKVAGEIL